MTSPLSSMYAGTCVARRVRYGKIVFADPLEISINIVVFVVNEKIYSPGSFYFGECAWFIRFVLVIENDFNYSKNLMSARLESFSPRFASLYDPSYIYEWKKQFKFAHRSRIASCPGLV